MPASNEIVEQQQQLLAIHRRTLAHLCKQAAQYGGEVFAPTHVANGIYEARENIRCTKKTLRDWGVYVEEHPNDKENSYFSSSIDVGVNPSAGLGKVNFPPLGANNVAGSLFLLVMESQSDRNRPKQKPVNEQVERRRRLMENAPETTRKPPLTIKPLGEHRSGQYVQYGPITVRTRREKTPTLCPKCESVNTGRKKFCNKCGSPLYLDET